MNKYQKNGASYYDYVSNYDYDSYLEIPNGTNSLQNAWLTIVINYEIKFADSKNPIPGLIFTRPDGVFAKDSDGAFFPIDDWDGKSRVKFEEKFKRGGCFWNRNFLLVTPNGFSRFDYESLQGAGSSSGWICRPNILCMFALNDGRNPNYFKTPVHLTIRAVRAKTVDQFRSNGLTYDDNDVDNSVVWHELGHALGQKHIKALFGDKSCMIDINQDVCYDNPFDESKMKANIMGRGTGLHIVNAAPWWERIAEHTDTSKFQWCVTQMTDLPPRRMPLGLKDGLMPNVAW